MPQSQPQTFDFNTAIQRAISDFVNAANARDAKRLANLYTDDATLLPPGSPIVKGRSNIQSFWQNFMNAGAGNPELQTVSVEASGDLAYEIGTFNAILPTPDGGTGRAVGKYLVIWKQQSDGTVRMSADMFSLNS